MEQRLGNYLLMRLLGRGGFADVYYGEHIYLKTPAAVKVLNVQITGEEHEKFLTEAQIVARLEHPHIIAVMEFGFENNTPYLVIDYAANGSLRQRYPRGTQFAPMQIAPYTEQIASALQYTHNQNLIHRDVKPENMLLGSRNDILLSDFGIALVVQNAQPTDGQQSIVGTIAYMAPEQLNGVPGPASDQYALGAVIYEWLSGEPPFYGSFAEVAIQHALVPPVPLRKRIPQLSADVEEVVLIALAKEPQARFKSIKAFATAFVQASMKEQEGAVPVLPDPALTQPEFAAVGPEEGTARPQKRLSRRMFAISLGLLGGAGLVAGGALAWKPLAQKLQTLLPAPATPLPRPKSPVLPPGSTLHTYHGHPFLPAGKVIFWSSDSKRIASSGGDVQIWYAMTGKLDRIYRSEPYSSYVSAMAWSPNNKYIVAEISQSDGTSAIQVWEASSGQSVYGYHQTLSYQTSAYQATILEWSPDNALIASSGASSGFDPATPIPTIQVWNALTGDQLATYRGHTSEINSLTWSPDGNLIASADGDMMGITGASSNTVHVWEVATGHTRFIYHGHPDPVGAVVWSPNGQLIASGGGSENNMQASNPNNNTVQIWKPDSDKPLLIYHGHIGPVKTVSWSPNSKFVVSGSGYNGSRINAGLVQVWDVVSGKTLLSYQGHNHQYYSVTAVAWSPDDKLIASADSATVQVWRAI